MPEATGTAPIPIHLDLIHVVLKGVFTSLFDNVPCIRCLILQSRSNGQCSTQCLQGNSFLFLSWQAKKQHVDIPRMSKLVWHWLAIQRSDLGQRQVFVLDLQAMFGSQCSQSFETPDFDMPENSVLNNYIAHFTCSLRFYRTEAETTKGSWHHRQMSSLGAKSWIFRMSRTAATIRPNPQQWLHTVKSRCKIWTVQAWPTPSILLLATKNLKVAKSHSIAKLWSPIDDSCWSSKYLWKFDGMVKH